jgi:hypothetical protein
MTGLRSDLLKDLARLVKRHPSREWLRLANLLQNEQARSRIIAFFKQVADVADSAKRPVSRGVKRRPNASSKSVLRGEGDERERLELELARSSISELREIAKTYGLAFSTKDSRHRLIKRILVVRLNKADKKRAVTRSVPRQDRGDYAQWADIIIGGNRPKR